MLIQRKNGLSVGAVRKEDTATMRDWLDDPENREAYEQFLRDCGDEDTETDLYGDYNRKEASREEDNWEEDNWEEDIREEDAETAAGRRTSASRRRASRSRGTARREPTAARRRTSRREIPEEDDMPETTRDEDPDDGRLPDTARQRSRRKRRRRRKSPLRRIPKPVKIVLVLAVIVFILSRCAADRLPFALPFGGTPETGESQEEEVTEDQTRMITDRWYGAPSIDVQLLTPNEYSRPQIPLKEVNGIVVHYTANPGSTAQNNRNYFENLSKTGENSVSSHFVIGLDGEIVQCIPCDEVAYASNERNSDTISIECCHPDETGQFTDATYQSLVNLVAWLCRDRDVPVSGVIRHYDVTGKNCPKYFVEHEDAWDQFRQDVQERLDALNNGTL